MLSKCITMSINFTRFLKTPIYGIYDSELYGLDKDLID